ncbi:trihelix transcription factor PTL-like [Cynara cardunculus var. scolymus]|uniref:Myb-like domain-containing protein n=1 Tax=Cynara cardunculus var. scolymus TaxID=59895 RepID=A0A103XFA2_CYNCS|nr:trihelix transcription factor PTL-like [Cynara cardunculus var. scolymus]KVH89689.1 Myb-like domain-containing protein [Cynara cardunculus var. scolymus]
MEEQYGITDLTHYMNGRPIFTAVPQPPPQPQPPHDLHYDMVMLGGGGGGAGGMLFRSDSTTGTGSTTASLSAGGGLEMELGGGLEMEIGGGGCGGGNGRWPRQETLTLLEVRSRLDSKFKEANQKGPLWDEVSRIMSEEHGYQRSGKKCREKFENLYKYYKKTKEGKAGRQDGKHYRFFRQLEALYGETSTSINPNPNPNPASFPDPHNLNVETSPFQTHPHPNNSSYQEAFHQPPPSRLCDSPSLSNNSSAFDTSSSGYSNPNAPMPPFMDNSDCADRTINKRRLGKRSWKTKIKEFIDAQMRKIMEKQEEWMEKMMKSIEQKEQERVLREEQWRKEEASRFEKEHKFWANERAWMESRDSALMEALHKITGKESNHKSSPDHHNDRNNGKIDTTVNLTGWGENEITRLIQLRTSMETRFEQGGYMEELLWEEIASKMTCLGYNRNGISCKTKWDSINEFLMRTKKRKENTRSSNSYTHHNNESLSHIFHHQVGSYRQADERLMASNDQQNDAGSYRFLMGDPENMWDGYGVKLTKGDDH